MEFTVCRRFRKTTTRSSRCLRLMWISLYIQVLSSHPASPSPAFPAVFTFGDSILDVGNNNWLPTSLSKANYAPNGIDFPRGPTGRFSNGKNIIDAITDRVGLPSSPPFMDPQTSGARSLQGVNYASGAAGILNDTGLDFISILTMSQQIECFKNTSNILIEMLGIEATTSLLLESLFVVGIGANDYINNYLHLQEHSRSRPEDFQQLLLTTFSTQLIELYKIGARKFMIMSIGTIGCIPYELAISSSSGSCVEDINNLAKAFNIGLQKILTELKVELAEAKLTYIDTFGPSLKMGMYPFYYGFISGTEACCGSGRFKAQFPCLPGPFTNVCINRRMHVYWDAFHPSEAASIILGGQFYDQLMADLNRS